MPQTDPWSAFPAVTPPAAVPAAPAYPGVIPGRPKVEGPPKPDLPTGWEVGPDGVAKPITGLPTSLTDKPTFRTLTPDEAKARGLDPTHSWQVGSDGKVDDLGGGPGDPAAYGQAKTKLARLIHQMNTIGLDANDNGGWFETGATGSITRSVPGTAAYDIQSNLQTLNSSFAFDALQAMRDASKTGGALGQISDKEEELLRSTVANLDPNQSQTSFLKALASARDQYLEKLRAIDPKAADELSQDPGPFIDKNGDLGVRYLRDDGSALTNTSGGGDSAPPAGGGGAPPGGGGVSPFMASVGDIGQGLGDIVGIAGNPLNATINAVAGTHLSTDLGETFRSNILGVPHGNSPTMEMINRGATGALTGSLLARGAATVLSPGVVNGVLQTIGKTPMRDAIAGASGGAVGALGKASGIPGGELVGNVVGALAGYGGASAANGLANTIRTGVPNALARDAAHLGVDMLPADAGGPVAKAITTGAKASPFSVAPIVKASQGHQAQMGDAARRIAESQGEIVTTDKAGLSVRDAAKAYTKETAQRASRLYTRAGKAAEGVLIKPTQTLAKLDEYIARVKNNPGAPEGAARELESFRDKIADGVNAEGLRDARTTLSQGTYDGKLRSGQDKGMWKDILGDLSTDIQGGLASAGRKDAASMFKTADSYWKARVEHIDEVLQPILGKGKGGEEVVKSIESMARGSSGGNARLSRLLANMKPEEAGQVRAVVIDRIGKANPGGQGAAGDTFSAGTFLTNWNKMTPQAKGSLFADSGLRKDLDALANLSEKMKASQAMANHSNTGIGTMSNVGLQGAFALTHPVFAAIAIGGQYVTGKLMASPAVARLLARTAKMPPEQAGRTLTQQLGVIAAREPLVANDARNLQQFLSQSFAQSPTRAAAQGQQERDRGQPPPQQ